MWKTRLRTLLGQFPAPAPVAEPVPATQPALPSYFPPPGYPEELIPNPELYRPVFSPWLSTTSPFWRWFMTGASRTLVSPDRCYLLLTLVEQAIDLEGDIWECGVYKGGTAAMMTAFLDEVQSSKRIFLFDTFAGMPETDPTRDWHKQGDFADTSLDAVRAFVGGGGRCEFRPGLIPQSFAGLEDTRIALAHIDVDIYRSILDCMDFIWPRLAVGGFVIFDDYGFPTCPGARRAVDEFFHGARCRPLCLPTGQALVVKSFA